jgi:glycosyltransferase involved in cell wall biosynthesis
VIELASFTELHRASAACDALVLPRQVRCGLPIKLLNYLAMGGVVIAASGGFDLITHEQDGLVVDGDGAAPIARALARGAVDVDLARRLRVGARRKFVKDLTWATAAPALESVYAEATGAWRAAQAARAMIR